LNPTVAQIRAILNAVYPFLNYKIVEFALIEYSETPEIIFYLYIHQLSKSIFISLVNMLTNFYKLKNNFKMESDHPMHFWHSYLVKLNVPVPTSYANWEEFLLNLYNIIIGQEIEIIDEFGLD